MLFSRKRHTAAWGAAQTPLACFAPLIAVLTAAGLSGCSMALSSDSTQALWGGSDEDVTGSIRKSAALRLSDALDEEDLRRASAAMNTALDPQGSGAAVNWDNPESGARGSFKPAGFAYPLDGKVCRAFVAEIGVKNSRENVEGAACREKSAEWALTKVTRGKTG